MTLLALLALVASALVWAAPGSQAQSNIAPTAVASVDTSGTDANGAVRFQDGYLVNPTGPIGAADTSSDVTVTLASAGSTDVDGDIELLRWEILTGPYDWIEPTPLGDPEGTTATFTAPSQAFIDSVSDNDPQKYEIVARLTVTDDDGDTDTDTVTIYLNQRPTATISLYAGVRDHGVVADPDTTTKDLYSIPGVIDGPGENGNADNEWDVVGGAYVELDGFASSDPENVGGRVASYRWTLVSSTGPDEGINDTAAGGGRFVVGGLDNRSGDRVDSTDSTSDLVDIVQPPGVGNRYTLFYRLTVCDRAADAAATPTVCATANPTLSRSSIIRIVVHDTSAAPELRIGAGLTTTSVGRGDEPPQGTVGQITGVDGQFIVDAGSTVLLSASVTNPQRSMGSHTYRWTGASQQQQASTATVRVPAGAEDGDTIDVSVTAVNDGSRLSTTVPIQLLVGTNKPPRAEGVPANSESISGQLYVHSITDGFQNPRDGSTVTLRGVATDPDGGSLITSWVLREANTSLFFSETAFLDGNGDGIPETDFDLNGDGDTSDTRVDADAALQSLVERWLAATPNSAGQQAIGGAALTAFYRMLSTAQAPVEPLVDLNGALTTTVSFEVPNLKSTVLPAEAVTGPPARAEIEAKNNNKGSLMYFTVIDSAGVASVQFIYLLINADDDAPNADAGPDLQVGAGGFARLNGSASADADIKDELSYRWDYVGATMDPLPNQRPPLTDGEIRELTGWVLRPVTDDEANEPGLVRDSDGNRYKYIVNSSGNIIGDADLGADAEQWYTVPTWFDPEPAFEAASAGGKLLGRTSAYPWFDAPDFSGFNDIKLRFRLNARDTAGTDLGGGTGGVLDGDISDTLTVLNEIHVGGDLNNNMVSTDPEVNAGVREAAVSLDLNGDGDALDVIADLTADGAEIVERNVSAVDEDIVVVTVSRRYFTGNIPSPDFCTNRSLGGPQTYPLDSDGDGVADTCSLTTTRRATVANQNALENLAGVFPGQFRLAVIAVCEDPVFRQTDWLVLGDNPDDLGNDACATERVSPPPAPVDPTVADVFFSGVITGQDFCTNHSLGGARTYANDIDGDGVADQCSLATTRREAVARQRALGTFNVRLSSTEATALSELGLLFALEAKMTQNGYANSTDNDNVTAPEAGLTADEQAEYARIFVKHVARATVTVVGFNTRINAQEQGPLSARLSVLRDKNTRAIRYSSALGAECRALGSQDFGDAAGALARDECNPRPGTEVQLPAS